MLKGLYTEEKSLTREQFEQKYIYLPETLQESYEVMHAQSKNAHGTIFGGQLMKDAFEMAFLAVRLYSGDLNPQLKLIDNTNFIKAVNIG